MASDHMTDRAEERGVEPNRRFELCNKTLIEAWRTAQAAWAPLEPDWSASQIPRGRPPYLHGRTYGDRGYTSPPPLPPEGKAVKTAYAALEADYQARLGDGRIVVTGKPAEGVGAQRQQIPAEQLRGRVIKDRMIILGFEYQYCLLFRRGDFVPTTETQTGGGGDDGLSKAEKLGILRGAMVRLFAEKPCMVLVDYKPRQLFAELVKIDRRIKVLYKNERQTKEMIGELRVEMQPAVNREMVGAVETISRAYPGKPDISFLYKEFCGLKRGLGDYYTEAQFADVLRKIRPERPL